MPNINPTPNMSLPNPVVGVDPGPDYATNVDSCFIIIDGHDHSPGNGVKVTPSGLNINADLTFLSNNAIALRSARFTPQGSPLSLPADLGCIYESGVDLYYNDGNGNQIRITQGGTLVASGGSIAGLVPPASASYNTGSGTFIWQSNVNTPANMDMASITIREKVVSPNGITISSPTSLAANYTLVLPPALPSISAILSSDPSGNMSFVTIGGAIVGPGGFSTITAAISGTSANDLISVSPGTYTENITLSSPRTIVGSGRNTVVNGTWHFATGSDDSLVRQIKFGNGFVIDSGVKELQVDDFWIASTFFIDDNSGNSNNFYRAAQE